MHFTGEVVRLDRLIRCADRQACAFEGLVAKIGPCLLFATLAMAPLVDQSAACVAGWLQALTEDKRVIFRAASAAQKAMNLILARCSDLCADGPNVQTEKEAAA